MLKVRKGRESINIGRTLRDCDWPEKIFVTEWRKLQRDRLGFLTSLGAGTTDRDFQVAETVIQWLGSLVGESWLRSVIGKIYAKKAPGQRCAVIQEDELRATFVKITTRYPPWDLGGVKFTYMAMCSMLGFKPNWKGVIDGRDRTSETR